VTANFQHGESVTVLRPGTLDRYGDPVPGNPSTTHTIEGCAFAPRSSTELHAQVNTVIVGLTMYAPSGADIKATDTIQRSDGTRWNVEGQPGVWSSPFTGWQPGIVAALERVTG